ncbi:MAG: superoxide dismutase [Caulobacter sp.]|nr:superoxide dismutase [Caulobacter sp.]
MFVLPDLPYPSNALEPVISARTMGFHHGKHHKAYVDAVNAILAERGTRPASLEDVVRASAGDGGKLFNSAGQAWNHAMFWVAMDPAGGAPSGDLAQAIDAAFGGLDGLKTAFVTAGGGHFGSGWVWLVAEGGALKVITTHDAGTPLTMKGVTPLMVCDLWEHAYYLDHQNDRKGFLEAWFDSLPNWALAQSQWAAARGGGAVWRYPDPA